VSRLKSGILPFTALVLLLASLWLMTNATQGSARFAVGPQGGTQIRAAGHQTRLEELRVPYPQKTFVEVHVAEPQAPRLAGTQAGAVEQ